MAIVCHGKPRQARGFCVSGGGVFTIAELAWHYGKAPGTIGRWVSEDSIEGAADPFDRRRKRYPLSAVQQAYDRRHGTA